MYVYYGIIFGFENKFKLKNIILVKEMIGMIFFDIELLFFLVFYLFL